ncbi:MAG: amino acid--tRNA ligase-related protein, partial [bacterium]|nr:amino acid--tRNA ligase-related protein [bacterium]
KEAQQLDEEYLEAMEYGMPPNHGFGFSERLFSILVDKPIRETVFFPILRPRSKSKE